MSNDDIDAHFKKKLGREKYRQLLEIACEFDRSDWQKRTTHPTNNTISRALGILRFLQPVLPRYVRYAIAGYALARKIWH